jgi:hypothetical protein
MLLQDTSINEFSQQIDRKLWTALQDIATNVQIQDNFCISHPNYKPLELPPEAAERLQTMPLNLQQKYLSSQLRSFLYGLYYNGSFKTALAPDSDVLIQPQDLENNTFLGMDLAFYERLHESNTGEGYFYDGWVVVREEDDGAIAVAKDGLTLHIQRDLHLKSADEPIVVGKTVAIRLPKNLVQNGFYMAVGNLGSHSPIGSPSQLIRIYWSLSPEGAIAVMNSLTQKFNDAKLPFSFKVLYNPSDYVRHDSGVLYFDNHHYESVRSILQSIYTEHQAHFHEDIPLFTKLLAPGLGLAEEPTQKFEIVESFGMNRCQIVANGLLLAQEKADNSVEGRMKSILEQFSLLGINLQQPYLNAESSDIYSPLNLI